MTERYLIRCAARRCGSDARPNDPLHQVCARENPVCHRTQVVPILSGRGLLLIPVLSSVGFTNESKRLYGVLEMRLKDREWLAGPDRGKYSIADMNVLPWIRIHRYTGIENLDEFPNVKVSTPYYTSKRELTVISVRRPGLQEHKKDPLLQRGWQFKSQ